MDHHYIPEGYLKGWGRADKGGQLVEYTRRPWGLQHRWTHPGGTGYEKHLYSIPALEERSDVLERELMGMIDDRAASILAKLRSPSPSSVFRAADRAPLATFVTSLFVRSPESIRALKAAIERWWWTERPELQVIYERFYKQIGFPDGVMDYLSMTATEGETQIFLADVLPELAAHKRISSFLAKMHWRIIAMPEGAVKLLTSDRPLIMTNGLTVSDGHFAIAISPDRMFIATRSEAVYQQLMRGLTLKALAKRSNRLVVERAKRFVYAADQSQAAFIAKHFGTAPIATLGETVAARDPWAAGRRVQGNAIEDEVADFVSWARSKGAQWR